ncbi:o-succinylbenzoate--CoA ligase [Pseudarthrobacter sp. YAF2]|uniref:o-succinylbenzoate--CoA ligase n=1 Tax=Pseudarthrobacter sp. YAF2 TaxID=3233078 RepID=UPI003F956702
MENNGIGSWPQRRRPKSRSKVALISGNQVRTYEQLDDRSAKLANALRDCGVGKGNSVAYLGENHPAFLEVLFACGLLGATFVPLNTRLAPPELQFQIQDCGAVALIHAGSLERLASAAVQGTQVSIRVVVDDTTGHPSRPVGNGSTVHVADFEQLLGSASNHHVDEKVGLDDPAMILYTSGTTGRPKGALLTHGNIAWNCFNVIVDFDFSSSDVALMISPLFHVASLAMGVLPTLLKGGTVVLETKFDPARTLGLIREHRVTTLSGVPTTFQMICEHPDWDTADLSSLNKLTCGGSAVPKRVLEAYEQRGLRFSNGYGMTETAAGVTTLPADRSRDKMGSSGLPHFFTSVRIAEGSGTSVPTGTVGEIQIKGPNVIRRYWERPDASVDSYTVDGWFKSGDIGFADEEGFVFVSDRLKDMIISGGENIYPAEVEQIINELPEVYSVAVIGIPDQKWGEVPRAVIVLRSGSNLSEEEIQAHLDGRLARYKIPKSIVFVDEMPRTASGKILKSDLRKHASHTG